MILKNEETTRNLIYSVPGLVEMEKSFDQIIITGSHNSLAEFDSYFASRIRKNVTDYGKEKQADILKYYLLTQPQAFNNFSEVASKYIFLRSPSRENVTQLARVTLESTSNREVAKRAIIILDIIENQLQSFDISTLPPIRIAELEDERVIIEWIFENFRMGFNLELDDDESGYFQISDKSAGEIRSSGYLKGLKLEVLIRSLLTLVLNN